MGMSGAEDRADLLVIEVDVLISGAGPAGASLAWFLASHDKFKSLFSGYKAKRIHMVGYVWIGGNGIRRRGSTG